MALARVVTFEGVDSARIAELKRNIEEGERPDDVPASEIVILHDADANSSMAIVFFDNEEDYRRGDAALGGMPAEETPGRRTSVGKYDVAVRRTS
jgi:hypothetical protein